MFPLGAGLGLRRRAVVGTAVLRTALVASAFIASALMASTLVAAALFAAAAEAADEFRWGDPLFEAFDAEQFLRGLFHVCSS